MTHTAMLIIMLFGGAYSQGAAVDHVGMSSMDACNVAAATLNAVQTHQFNGFVIAQCVAD